MTTTESNPTSAAETWTAQLDQLQARYKHVRLPILAALNILRHAPEVSTDDAKMEAARHGVRITAASIAAAQRLLARAADAEPTQTAPAKGDVTSSRPARRARGADPTVDAEALIRGVVAKIQGQGSAEAERMRAAMRKAVAVLIAAGA